MAITITKEDLNIKYQGSYIFNYDINPAWITGDVEVDLANTEIRKLQPGVFITIDNKGHAVLADGATAVHAKAVVVAATRGFYTNAPAVGSKKVTAIGAPAVIETVQVKETDIAAGDALYVGTGSDVGLLTKTKGSSTLLAGYALTGNSATDKAVTVELI